MTDIESFNKQQEHLQNLRDNEIDYEKYEEEILRRYAYSNPRHMIGLGFNNKMWSYEPF